MRCVAIIAAAVLAIGSDAYCVPDYGFQWATIGDPGNRPTLLSEVPRRQFSDPEYQHFGDVAYEYRMARTEVTIAQWFEFVQAYSPFHEGSPLDSAFTGRGIFWSGSGYFMARPPDSPTDMGWEFAARYCNWLHNGKALTREAFENGAYDTSLFTVNPDGSKNHQGHLPGALYWIPSIDEWTKGMHWDPDKNGKGSGGFWYHPISSDSPPIPGLPADGGETNNGVPIGTPHMSVGSYPNTQSPWGLLDGSGGVHEFTESFVGDGRVTIRGSSQSFGNSPLFDELDFWTSSSVSGIASGEGLRLASAVPTPSAAMAFGVASLCLCVRRRRG